MGESPAGAGGLKQPSDGSGLLALKSPLLLILSIVSLRDKDYSKNLIAELGLPGVASKVVFDEAFSLPPAPEETAREWLVKAALSATDSFVAFHYRETDYTPNPSDPVARVGEILKLARAQTGLKFLFVPMSYAQHSRIDSELGRKLGAYLGHPDWFHLLPECRDARLIKAIIGRAKFSLGLSYHLHVFSLSQGHPALILYTGAYYGLKSDGLIAFYGPPSRVLELDAVQPAGFALALQDIGENYESACQGIAKVNAALRHDNDWTLKEIKRRFASAAAA